MSGWAKRELERMAAEAEKPISSLLPWPEPQPSDGPEYHANHAFWREAAAAPKQKSRCTCGRAIDDPCLDCE